MEYVELAVFILFFYLTTKASNNRGSNRPTASRGCVCVCRRFIKAISISMCRFTFLGAGWEYKALEKPCKSNELPQLVGPRRWPPYGNLSALDEYVFDTLFHFILARCSPRCEQLLGCTGAHFCKGLPFSFDKSCDCFFFFWYFVIVALLCV